MYPNAPTTQNLFDPVASRLNETAGADIDELVARFAAGIETPSAGLDSDQQALDRDH